jgi:hypothetical protein
MNDLKAKQQLQDMVDKIAQDITDGMTYQEAELDHEEHCAEPGDQITAFDWLLDALDIQYIVTGDGEYLGARVLVAFGGPNIWVNTQEQTVKGYWWGDTATAHYMIDSLGLDDALRELWECK